MCSGVNCGWHRHVSPVNQITHPSAEPPTTRCMPTVLYLRCADVMFAVLYCCAAAQQEGHHRGRQAPGHISFFKRYDTVGSLGAHLSAAPTPEEIITPPHSAWLAAQERQTNRTTPGGQTYPGDGNASSASTMAAAGSSADSEMAAEHPPVLGANGQYAGAAGTGAGGSGSGLQQLLERTQQLHATGQD